MMAGLQQRVLEGYYGRPLKAPLPEGFCSEMKLTSYDVAQSARRMLSAGLVGANGVAGVQSRDVS